MMRWVVPAAMLAAWVASSGAGRRCFARPKSIAPKTLTLDNSRGDLKAALAAVTAQTGIGIDAERVNVGQPCPVKFDGKPFWQALDAIAAATGNRVSVGDQGRRVSLVPKGDRPTASDTDGPFRVAVREVLARYDADTGRTRYDVLLDLSWEPRFPVFLIEQQPSIWKAADDRGTALKADPGTGKDAVAGFAASVPVQVHGLTRAAKTIRSLEGGWTLLAADEVRTFRFDKPAESPPAQKKQGATATLTRFKEYPDAWECTVDIDSPDNAVNLESFQQGLIEHKLYLESAGGGRVEANRYEAQTQGARAVVRASFPRERDGKKVLADPAKWAVVCESPVPREVTVRFKLENVPLP
jgi:hypothetical protein